MRKTPALAALLILALALTSCARGGRQVATPTVGDSPIDGRRVAALLPIEGAEFTATYRWGKGDLADLDRQFVWRQSGGMRRWDYGGATGHQGTLAIQLELSHLVDGFLPANSLTCTWSSKSGSANVTCSTDLPSDVGSNAMFFSRNAPLGRRLPDRTIAGRTAECYEFPDVESVGAVCASAADRVMLYFRGRTGIAQRTLATFEAISVTIGPPGILLPDKLRQAALATPAAWPLQVSADELALPK